MKTEIVEKEDRVFIDPVPRLEGSGGRDNSFVRSAQLTLNSLDENYSYDFLMGISGAAFRLHFHPEWCPSAADATVGFDVSPVLFDSLGIQVEIFSIDTDSFDEIRSLYQKVVKQINRGIPVIAINLKVSPEWGIITGYLKKKPGLLCRTYFDESDEYAEADRAPWLTFFITEKGRARDYRELFRNSLGIAARLAKTKSFKEYINGFRAFEKWIGELKDHPGAIRGEKLRFNSILFNCLADSRQAAARYMAQMNHHISLKNGDRIVAGYRDVVDLLDEVREDLNLLSGSASAGRRRILLNREAEVLVRVLDIEREIVGLMEYH